MEYGMIVHARGSDEEEPTVTDIFDELHWRGLVAQSTDERGLRRALESGPVTYYDGFDPTAPSLHVGHLVQVLTARRLQDAGQLPLPLPRGARPTPRARQRGADATAGQPARRPVLRRDRHQDHRTGRHHRSVAS